MSYDFRHLYYHTGKFPINYEDSQILAKTLINHVDTFKARTGLKELQGHKYSAWGISSDNFTLAQMNEPHVLHYAAIDAAATYDLWQYLQSQCDDIDATITATVPMQYRPTSDHYSPHDQLPAPVPAESTYLSRHFYENTGKHLIKDTVTICDNGLGIDLEKVSELEVTIQNVVKEVEAKLSANPIIVSFLDSKYGRLKERAVAKRNELLQSRVKPVEHFLKPFKHKDLIHRSYFMYIYCNRQGISQPDELLPGTTIPKWESRLVKRLAASRPLLQRLLDGKLTDSNHIVAEAMLLLATHKATLHNSKLELVDDVPMELPLFNPRSSDDKYQLLTELLGYESGKLTDAYQQYERDLAKAERYGREPPNPPKTKWSWGRKQIAPLLDTVTDDQQRELFQCLVDFSFGDKILTSFIPAFYKYTVNGRLYSNLKLFGALSARFTSNNPNMLQLPSTGSIYAKPIKKCFVAPKDKVIFAVDLNALEDRVLASLTLDEGKCMLLEDETIDGHCYNALGYYYDQASQYLTPNLPFVDQAREFKLLVESKHPELKSLRQESKAVTFKLGYFGMADSHKGGAITPEIYNNYHTKLYPKVRQYVDTYVIPTADHYGRLHLGLGFYLNTEDANRDFRTLHNATCQFWSVLTILTINKLHQLINENGMQSRVKVISSIYDSIYLDVDKDPEVIKWVNDTIIPLLTTDFIPNQRIPNSAEAEIGLNWADLVAIPNNATLDDITTILSTLE